MPMKVLLRDCPVFGGSLLHLCDLSLLEATIFLQQSHLTSPMQPNNLSFAIAAWGKGRAGQAGQGQGRQGREKGGFIRFENLDAYVLPHVEKSTPKSQWKARRPLSP